MGEATGVAVDNAHQSSYMRACLGRWIGWEANVVRAIATLAPERDLSFLEVSLFAWSSTAGGRQVLALDPPIGLARLRPTLRGAPLRAGDAGGFKFDFPADLKQRLSLRRTSPYNHWSRAPTRAA